jgi:hypothetical protein
MKLTADATPAEIAGEVLDAILATPAAFDMSSWAALGLETELRPEADPVCGTTLCAAGWVAHLTGWTIIQTVNDRGGQRTVLAERDGVTRSISLVAEEALGLTGEDAFWIETEEDAIHELRKIAGRI